MTTDTIPLSLDGYTDLPPGKIANVVTYLKRTEPPPQRSHRRRRSAIRRVSAPTAAWYRDLYRRIGQDWLWFAALAKADAELTAVITNPTTAILTIVGGETEIGLAELSFAPPAVEIVMFGVVPEAIGTGAGATLLDAALAEAFRPGIERVWLHTCTFDHPAAMPFYLRHGFRAYKYAIEVTDDPRLRGLVPPAAAPHVPLIRPAPFGGG